MGLALVRDSGGRDHLAGHQHLHVRAFIRPDPGPLHIHGKTHADVIALRTRTEHLDRALEESRIVAAVVDDLVAVLPRDPNLIWKFVRLDEVPSSNLETVELELGRDHIQRALHHKARVGAARAAIGRGRRGVRVNVSEPDPIVGHSVRPAHLARGDDRQHDSIRRVRAGIVDEVVIEREHVSVVVEPNLNFVHLASLVVDGGEVLLPVLGPLHRAPEPHGGERNQQLVGVKEHDLRPEASADIGGDHIDVGLRESEPNREAAADRCRRLRGVIDGEAMLRLGPAGPDCPRLYRTRGSTFEAKVQLLSVWRRGQGSLHVSLLLDHLGGDVAGHVVVDQVGCRSARLWCDHDRQRLVIDFDEIRSVLGDVAVLRDNESDGLTHIPNYVRRQASLRAPVGQVGMRDENGQVGIAEGEIGCDVNRDHAGQRPCCAHVDRLDASVGEMRPDQDGLERAFIDVVREVALAAQQPIILDPLHPLAEPARGHGFVSSAARCTARRIDAYPVHRQRLPEIPSFTCSGVGLGFWRRSPTTDITKPGVQKPH